MQPFSLPALFTAFLLATLLAVRALKKKRLTKVGAIAGWIVGFLLVATGLRGLTLFFFYQIGSMATKVGLKVKNDRDATTRDHSVRGATQVLAVSVLAVALSLWHAMGCGVERSLSTSLDPLATSLSLAILAHHATCLGDTLASELGMLASQPPRLVLPPFVVVPAGTNGGMTLWGTLWSGVGGALCGLFQIGMDVISGISPLNGPRIIAFAGLCGLLGSFLDSIMGATLQATYYDTDSKLVYHSDKHPASVKRVGIGRDVLTNEQVNFVSVAATSYLGGWVIGPLIFP